MAEQYTNIKIILDKLLRHPLLQSLSLESAVDYTIDFMRIVGVPNMFEEKTQVLEVKNYKALLPCDYYQVIQIRDCKTGETFRYASDSFHMSKCKKSPFGSTYKIQGGVIHTSIEEGNIEISYEAIPIDNEGYPKIPDNSSFTRALELYIKKSFFTILFDLNKISPAVLQNTQQEYAWAVGDCQSEFNRLSIDKMESFSNSWKTLITRATEHEKGFINNGAREYIRVH